MIPPLLRGLEQRCICHSQLSGRSEPNCRLSSLALSMASVRVFDRIYLAAARNARRNAAAVVRHEPGQPIRPPGARMLDRLGQPAVEVGAGGLAPGPILVLVPVRRVDDAGDVAR